MDDEIPSEPVKYAINPFPLVIGVCLALAGVIETLVLLVRMAR